MSPNDASRPNSMPSSKPWRACVNGGSPSLMPLIQALPAEVVSLLLQGVSPTDLPRQYHKVIFHIVQLGPYVRSRWREDAHTSTISLGLLNDSPPSPSPLRASNATVSTRQGAHASLRRHAP
ncbi:hypothetical protein [Ktedonospora formicarum]|uniref:hypothetical protein n=1 Tax=Ktedonospora formicarum TaxID=2778364 RepID=UPI001C68C43A|nr:hypothetical protein [Ktedonospora formicarum]